MTWNIVNTQVTTSKPGTAKRGNLTLPIAPV